MNSDRWRDWLNEHGPGLVLFARRWAPSQSDAEDIVQEAFVRFWRGRERVGEPVAYQYACVKRCAMDWRRTTERRARREMSAAGDKDECPFEPSGQDGERREAVEAALRRLPDEQRDVVVLKIWGGLTFQQVAGILDIPSNTAASRYRYALEALRAWLPEEVQQ